MKIRIKELRKNKKLTQNCIADFLSCDQSNYSKYEREQRKIPLKFIIKLAKFYGVSIDYLLGITDKRKP